MYIINSKDTECMVQGSKVKGFRAWGARTPSLKSILFRWKGPELSPPAARTLACSVPANGIARFPKLHRLFHGLPAAVMMSKA